MPENIHAYFKKLGILKVAMDISVPENNFEEMFRFYRKIMTLDPMQSILFGHIGENHLHFNLFPKDVQEKERAGQIYKNCVNKALSLGGTVAAEHGIGNIK